MALHSTFVDTVLLFVYCQSTSSLYFFLLKVKYSVEKVK